MTTIGNSKPYWSNMIRVDDKWEWRGTKLWHIAAAPIEDRFQHSSRIQRWMVKFVYADQNSSARVQTALSRCLATLVPNGIALNIGAGATSYRGVINLEVSDGPTVDIVNAGTELPFKDGTVDLVIAQEVLEHVADLHPLCAEINRILKPGGQFFCQVPFQIGFHPGPSDYWRFSRQALEYMFSREGWNVDEIEISLGHGSGFYRIAVEFAAVTASCLYSRFYKPTKGAASIALYPLKAFDLLTMFSPERDRIPAGYYCVARKAIC